MKNNWKIVTVILAIILIAGGSLWGYTTIKGNNDAKVAQLKLQSDNEMATLQTTFVQQYGNGAIIKQLVAPTKVYAALWTGTDNVSHVSWNLGGIWVVVWNSNQPTP